MILVFISDCLVYENIFFKCVTVLWMKEVAWTFENIDFLNVFFLKETHTYYVQFGFTLYVFVQGQ